MKFCKQCGVQLDEAVKFCPACGTACEQPAPEQQAPPQSAPDFVNDVMGKVKDLNNTADETATHDPQDIANNKVMAILAYIGFLVFIPAFAVKGSRFARFHANQGLLLFILNVGYGIVHFILSLLLQAIFPLKWTSLFAMTRGVVYNILSTVLGLVWIPLVALMVLGIINAATGKAKELPIIGKFKILK
ncbi:MAG: zinc-ribbon domain-containing protein [Clostridia bacterium]|nr:zinc-ribbon domain-containing protein [Clostridia bacterium]